MRVLIATVTAGGGHVAAACALEEAWKGERPSDVVERVDLLEFFSKIHAAAYTRGYVKFVEMMPELWGVVFRRTDNPAQTSRFRSIRRLVPGQSQKRFLSHLEAFAPDILLCTHYLPLDAIRSNVSKRSKPFVASVITDFEAHALWMEECIDLYCVAAEHTKARLVARGAVMDRIAVTGIPIAPKFATRHDEQAIRRRMGLRDDLPVILVLSGGFGMGPINEIVAEMDKTEAAFQIVAVTGKNAELRAELAVRDRAHPCHVLGYARNMDELMAVASLVVTKPGGLTSSEALALGKPLLIMNPIPGQEAANSDFLLENGAACKVNRPEDLPFRLADLLGRGKLEALSKAAKSLGRPESARAVCHRTIRAFESRITAA